MRLFTVLCLANLALANSYYISRRGIPVRGIPSRESAQVRTRINPKGVPPRRVNVKASSSSGGDAAAGDAAKRREKLPDPGASIVATGPASIFHVDEHGNSVHHEVPEQSTAIRTSKHAKRPQVGGVISGRPYPRDHLKIRVKGRHAMIKAESGLGGSGSYKGVGEDGVHEGKIEPGEEMIARASSNKGGATAEVRVSRPGAATAIGINSSADLDDIPGEGKT